MDTPFIYSVNNANIKYFVQMPYDQYDQLVNKVTELENKIKALEIANNISQEINKKLKRVKKNK